MDLLKQIPCCSFNFQRDEELLKLKDYLEKNIEKNNLGGYSVNFEYNNKNYKVISFSNRHKNICEILMLDKKNNEVSFNVESGKFTKENVIHYILECL